MVRTFLDGRHDLCKTLRGVADFLRSARSGTRDLDTLLILLTICATVMASKQLSRMQSLETLFSTDAASDLWTDERTLAWTSGLPLLAVRRRVEKLVEEGLLIRRDDQFTVHPEALADPRIGLNSVLRLDQSLR